MKKKEYHIHRKIWTDHFGPIPKDETGRSYEIHHIDGNHSNNHIDNLKCITIQEHYQIHKDQGDYTACLLITRAMNISPEEKSELLSQHNKKMVQEGIHPFLNKEKQRERQLIRVKNQEHHWQSIEHKEKITKWNLERSKNKTHPWNDGENQRKRQNELIKKGIHPFQDKEAARKRSKDKISKGTHPFQKEGFYEKIADKKSKEYLIKFPDGEIKKIKNLAKFCKENSLHRGLMRKVITGKQESHKGFKKG